MVKAMFDKIIKRTGFDNHRLKWYRTDKQEYSLVNNNKLVADTMALVLRLENRKMGPMAKSAFISAEKAEIGLIIPAMVLVGMLNNRACQLSVVSGP